MQKIILLFLSLLLFFSCNNTPTAGREPSEQADSTQLTKQEKAPQKEEVLEEETNNLPEINVNIEPGSYVGIYEGATFYTGSTDFAFEIDGELRLIRIMNDVYLDIEEGKEVAGYDLPADLLEQDEDLEGPPAGNPRWIGKKFKIERKDTSFSIQPIQAGH